MAGPLENSLQLPCPKAWLVLCSHSLWFPVLTRQLVKKSLSLRSSTERRTPCPFYSMQNLGTSQSCRFHPSCKASVKSPAGGVCSKNRSPSKGGKRIPFLSQSVSQSEELLVTQAVVHSPLAWKIQRGSGGNVYPTVAGRDFWVSRSVLSFCLFPSSEPRMRVGQCSAVSIAELAGTLSCQQESARPYLQPPSDNLTHALLSIILSPGKSISIAIDLSCIWRWHSSDWQWKPISPPTCPKTATRRLGHLRDHTPSLMFPSSDFLSCYSKGFVFSQGRVRCLCTWYPRVGKVEWLRLPTWPHRLSGFSIFETLSSHCGHPGCLSVSKE